MESGTRTRKRKFREDVGMNQWGSYTTGSNLSTDFSFKSGEITTDELHPLFRPYLQYRRTTRREDHREGLLRDYGGPFESVKYRYENDPWAYSCEGDHADWFRGRLFTKTRFADYENATHQVTLWKKPASTSTSDLDVFGAQAISRVSPVNSHSNVLQGLVELRREGLPSIPGFQFMRDRKLKSAGSEYLNYQFGMVPLYNEIQATAKAMANSEKLIKQYLRDSGRLVRRRYEPDPIKVVTRTTETTSSYPQGGANASHLGGSSPRYVVVDKTTTKWFSGAFTYHADSKLLGMLGDQIKRAEYLYGLKPDLNDLYNLTPWSWLVDWFTNTGDVVNNLSMFVSDGLVLSHGYVMEHTLQDVTYSMPNASFHAERLDKSYQKFSYERKVRRKANPFGFGLTKEDLTPRQWAILTALGLTQSGRYQG